MNARLKPIEGQMAFPFMAEPARFRATISAIRLTENPNRQ